MYKQELENKIIKLELIIQKSKNIVRGLCFALISYAVLLWVLHFSTNYDIYVNHDKHLLPALFVALLLLFLTVSSKSVLIHWKRLYDK